MENREYQNSIKQERKPQKRANILTFCVLALNRHAKAK